MSPNDTISNGQGAAIVMRQYGGPSVLQPEIVSQPCLRPDEIRIRTIAAAVNHSDLEIRAGMSVSRKIGQVRVRHPEGLHDIKIPRSL